MRLQPFTSTGGPDKLPLDTKVSREGPLLPKRQTTGRSVKQSLTSMYQVCGARLGCSWLFILPHCTWQLTEQQQRDVFGGLQHLFT